MMGRLFADDHEVTAVTSARHALVLLGRGQEFDVILCDLMMPGMSGRAFHTELALRSRDAADAVVFMASGVCSTDLRAFVRDVRNIVLEKPLEFSRLRMLVERRVRARRGSDPRIREDEELEHF
jgi:CheY-like chemotaxis protein